MIQELATVFSNPEEQWLIYRDAKTVLDDWNKPLLIDIKVVDKSLRSELFDSDVDNCPPNYYNFVTHEYFKDATCYCINMNEREEYMRDFKQYDDPTTNELTFKGAVEWFGKQIELPVDGKCREGCFYQPAIGPIK